jgi:hypothetical protein
MRIAQRKRRESGALEVAVARRIADRASLHAGGVCRTLDGRYSVDDLAGLGGVKSPIMNGQNEAFSRILIDKALERIHRTAAPTIC